MDTYDDRLAVAVQLLNTTKLQYGEIALQTGLSKTRVANLRRENSLRALTHEEVAENEQHEAAVVRALTLIRQGFRKSHAARECGISYATVIARCKRQDVRAIGCQEIYIYALRCPESKQAFYVGRTKNPWTRYYQHIHSPSSPLTARWISGLAERGLRPRLSILAHVHTDNPSALEADWIKRMVDAGHPLMNGTLCP